MRSSRIDGYGMPSADPEILGDECFLVIVHKNNKPITVAVVRDDTILLLASRDSSLTELSALNTRYKFTIGDAIRMFIALQASHGLRRLNPRTTETVGVVFPQAVDQG